LIIFHVIPSLAAYSGFHRQNKTKIPLADSQTLQQEWLASNRSRRLARLLSGCESDVRDLSTSLTAGYRFGRYVEGRFEKGVHLLLTVAVY
ncbi:MAG: hypothetical protein Q8761_03270, partial [Sweet potato little leaf phytoplasma]|nr:hypothetical protein [Sweet potato little leaf phytoplasma]